MTLEDGEWRIADAPDALVVPESWFEQRFRQVSLYFFDPTAQILVPEPVFVPRGEPVHHRADRGAAARPRARAWTASRAASSRPGLDFDLSVPVSEDGVADISLRGYSGQLTPEASELMITQLAWTLRPGARRSRRSGSPSTASRSPRPAGRACSSVDEALGVRPDRARLQLTSSTACATGCSCPGQPDALAPVDGPMGTDAARRPLGRGQPRRHHRRRGLAPAATGAACRRSAGPRRRVEEVVSGADEPAAPGLGLRRPAVAGRRDAPAARSSPSSTAAGRARSTCPGSPAGG